MTIPPDALPSEGRGREFESRRVRQPFRQFLRDLAWSATTRNTANARGTYKKSRTRTEPSKILYNMFCSGAVRGLSK